MVYDRPARYMNAQPFALPQIGLKNSAKSTCHRNWANRSTAFWRLKSAVPRGALDVNQITLGADHQSLARVGTANERDDDFLGLLRGIYGWLHRVHRFQRSAHFPQGHNRASRIAFGLEFLK